MGLSFPGGLTGSIRLPWPTPSLEDHRLTKQWFQPSCGAPAGQPIDRPVTDQVARGDADDLGAAFDLTIQSYQWIGRVELGLVVLGKLIKARRSVSASSIRLPAWRLGLI
jgi:hypothetical protein